MKKNLSAGRRWEVTFNRLHGLNRELQSAEDFNSYSQIREELERTGERLLALESSRRCRSAKVGRWA